MIEKYYPASASASEYEKIIRNIKEIVFTNDPVSDDHITYTIKHKIAIMALSFEYLGYVSRRIMLHDTEKLFLYSVIDTKAAHQIHVKNSCHHYPNLLSSDSAMQLHNHMEAVLDYECARYTKPDKPLNAYATIQKYYPESMKYSTDILNAFGINSEKNRDCKFEKWNLVSSRYLPIFYVINKECLEGFKSSIRMAKTESDMDSIAEAEALQNYYKEIARLQI